VKNEKMLKEKVENPYAPRKGDTAAVVEWRQRMGTPEAQAIYKQRCSSAEWVNAGCRNRCWYRVLVRGVAKVKCCALWQALAHNLMVALRVVTGRSDDARSCPLTKATVRAECVRGRMGGSVGLKTTDD
jgi:hypothetical protein